ncbi:MAG: iron-sulfur cluster repair protein YtfE [Pseudomonadales bacterium]|nr:iron-sulfur cluster repair protein YtfE [Pseudomonadales bacterium]
MNLQEQSLGYLASHIPGATGVFHEFRLDFCCAGEHSLQQAAMAKGLDISLLTAKLDNLINLPSGSDDWRGLGNQALIEHILIRYHEQHRQQLPELIRLAQRVERVHDKHGECPHGLTEHLSNMLQELESHMLKEENVLFPWLQQDHSPWPESPISMMRFEHQQHGEALAEIERITKDIQPPMDACNTWLALYNGLQAFRYDLMQHIHLENNILFAGLAVALTTTHP